MSGSMGGRTIVLGVAIGTVEPRRQDWPEDFGHENGRYVNVCCLCDDLFVGHKRRVACRECPPLRKATP